jgi:hypothetical protein
VLLRFQARWVDGRATAYSQGNYLAESSVDLPPELRLD